MERVRVLGTVAVRAEDSGWTPVTSPRRRTLLALLAARANHLLSIDRLADEVWNGSPPPTATTVIQAHIAALRDALEPDRPSRASGSFLFAENDGYVLRVETDELDVSAAEADLVAGDQHRRGGRNGDAAAHFAAAFARLDSEPFPGVECREIDQERRRLREQRSLAAEEAAAARIAAGEHLDVIDALRRVLADEPYRERTAGLLMIALSRAGRPRDALNVYATVRRRLAEDLGLQPSADLRDLERAVLARDRTVTAAPVEPAAIRHAGSPHHPLIGREHEIETVTQVLTAERAVALVGPPGVGTSAVARAVASRWDAAVHWIDAGECAPAHLLAAIADVIGARPGPVERLAASVSARAASMTGELVVVDGVDGADAQIGDALDRLVVEHGPSVLVTGTRAVARRDRRTAMQAIAIRPLDRRAARELLQTRAEAVRAGCTEGLEPDDVEALVARLDGLPLAIELAASRLWSLGPATLDQLLGDSIDVLGGPLRASIRVTLDQLEPEAGHALGQLGMLPAAFDLDLATALVGTEAGPLVASLADASLIDVDRDRPLPYRVLAPIRTAAHQRLSATDCERVLEAHTTWVLDRMRAAGRSGRDLGRGLSTEDFRILTPHFRSVADRLIAAGDGRRAVPLITAARYHFGRLGRVREGRRLLAAACALDGARTADRAEALFGAAVLAWWQGDFVEFPRLVTATTALVPEATTGTNLLRGGLAWMTGDLDSAAQMLDAALESARADDRGWERALSAAVAANVRWLAGDLETAASRFREAAVSGRAAGEHLTAGFGLRGHAYMAALLGDMATAQRLLARDAATLSTGDLVGRGQAALFGGLTAAVAGDSPAALRQLRHALWCAARTSDLTCFLLATCGTVALLADSDPTAASTAVGWIDAVVELGGPPLPARERAGVEQARTRLEKAVPAADLVADLARGATLTPHELAEVLQAS